MDFYNREKGFLQKLVSYNKEYSIEGTESWRKLKEIKREAELYTHGRKTLRLKV